eukprot:UN04191
MIWMDKQHYIAYPHPIKQQTTAHLIFILILVMDKSKYLVNEYILIAWLSHLMIMNAFLKDFNFTTCLFVRFCMFFKIACWINIHYIHKSQLSKALCCELLEFHTTRFQHEKE